MKIMKSKVVTVGSTGQISIGKKWAGKQVQIIELSSSELKIESGEMGSFIPDHHKCFYTPEAMKQLEDYNEWRKTHPWVARDIKKVFAELRKKKQSCEQSKSNV